jgi:16S rRNA (uracil1498-N3)-methyltransferase
VQKIHRIFKGDKMTNSYHLLPRLYVQDPLGANVNVALSSAHVHYLRNVLRRGEGDQVRLFNGRDGECACDLSALSKKNGVAVCCDCIREQSALVRKVHIYVSPLKKAAFDVLIQKAVELGVTDIHPVLYPRSTTRKLNAERVRAHIIEAAEQCERLDIPALHDVVTMADIVRPLAQSDVDIFAAIERHDVQALTQALLPVGSDLAFIVGPEGGFSDEDIAALSQIKALKPVNLGANVLRAETAALMCLSLTLNT